MQPNTMQPNTMQPNTTNAGFSHRLRSEMLMLHHRTLTDLCEWADGTSSGANPGGFACAAAPPVRRRRDRRRSRNRRDDDAVPSVEQTLEKTIENAVETAVGKAVEMVFRKAAELGLLGLPTPAADAGGAGDQEAAPTEAASEGAAAPTEAAPEKEAAPEEFVAEQNGAVPIEGGTAADLGLFADNDECRNSNRGRLSWGPASFEIENRRNTYISDSSRQAVVQPVVRQPHLKIEDLLPRYDPWGALRI
jgi:hypothetical protein